VVLLEREAQNDSDPVPVCSTAPGRCSHQSGHTDRSPSLVNHKPHRCDSPRALRLRVSKLGFVGGLHPPYCQAALAGDWRRPLTR